MDTYFSTPSLPQLSPQVSPKLHASSSCPATDHTQAKLGRKALLLQVGRGESSPVGTRGCAVFSHESWYGLGGLPSSPSLCLGSLEARFLFPLALGFEAVRVEGVMPLCVPLVQAPLGLSSCSQPLGQGRRERLVLDLGRGLNLWQEERRKSSREYMKEGDRKDTTDVEKRRKGRE